MLKIITSNEHVKSLLERLRAHRDKRLLVGAVAKEAFVSLSRRIDVCTKSEELALAFKEKGNTFYGSKLYTPALFCYNKVRIAPLYLIHL